MVLVVESGLGLSNAESYLSVADADTYHSAYGAPSGWAGSEAAKESALRIATQYLNAVYGQRWHGRRINSTMSLDWPRFDVIDRDGNTVLATAVPVAIRNATAYIALKVMEGESLIPDIATGSNAVAESVTVGPISISQTYSGAGTTAPGYPMADLLLSGLAMSAGSLWRA